MKEIHRHENGKAPAWEPGPFVYSTPCFFSFSLYVPSKAALIASAVRWP